LRPTCSNRVAPAFIRTVRRIGRTRRLSDAEYQVLRMIGGGKTVSENRDGD
jgi:DNA-binding CsgD family transcriptional regulator